MPADIPTLPLTLATALATGFGLGCLVLAARALAAAVRLGTRGLSTRGQVVARAEADPRPGGLILFSDHLGRDLVLDPGRYARLRGVPPIGARVPVVYLRNRPTEARPALPAYLYLPSFAWFLTATVICGTVSGVTR